MPKIELNATTHMLLAYGLKVLWVIILVMAALIMAGYTRSSSRKALQRAKVDETLTKFFSNIARWAILIMAGLSVMGVFGIEVASFAAVIAAAGFAVGLAFQGTLSNFAAGVMLLIFRPFRVGDSVKLGGQAGVVNEIDLFTTVLDTADNRRIIIPNSGVYGATIENSSHHKTRRVDVDMLVNPPVPAGKTRAAFRAILPNTPGLLAEPKPDVVFLGVTKDTNDWQLRAWVPADRYAEAREYLLEKAKDARDELQRS